MMKQFATLVLSLSLFIIGNAQIQEGGTPISLHSNNLHMVPVATMPGIDVASLKSNDAVFDQNKSIPWRFGQNLEVAYTLENSGMWQDLPNGDRLWLFAVESNGAQTINFGFKDFALTEGAKLFLYNAEGTDVIGAFTSNNNHESGIFATTLIRGEKIYFELYEPSNSSNSSTFTLNRVTHGYRSLDYEEKGIGDSGSCNNNTICDEGDDWRDQIRAVAIMVAGGNGFCTGTLINNTCQDGTPYFLTADHCVDNSSDSELNGVVFRFGFASTQCNSNTGPYPNTTVLGSSRKASNPNSDFALLELNSEPPASYEVYYAGWDRTGDIPGNQVGIHHPAGDLMKISFDEESAAYGNYSGAQCWRVFDWEDGTTEGGSSGSALFDEEKRIIGQLYGGQANCNNNVNDYYGRFDVSWDNGNNASNSLQFWLDDCNTGATVLDGFDPNTPSVMQDVRITMVNAPSSSSCGQVYEQIIRISNVGQQDVTNVVFEYGLDGALETEAWSGLLTTNQSVNVTLEDLNLASGAYNYAANITSSNFGVSDENASNDGFNLGFVVQNGVSVSVVVEAPLFDADENYFEIVNSSGSVVASEGPFANNQDYMFDYCLANDSYCFVMYDDAGNGMGSGFIGGSFEVFREGLSIFSGGVFTDIDSSCFNSPYVSIAKVEDSYQLDVFPNPAEDILYVKVDNNEKLSLVIFNAIGEISLPISTIQNNSAIDVSQLPAGIYYVKVSGEAGTSVRKLVLN